jgi:uncharacterized RDD family membrane protein YckC
VAGVRIADRRGEGQPAAGAPGGEAVQALSTAPAPPAPLRTRLAALVYEAVLLIPILFIAALLFLKVAGDASELGWKHSLFQLWLLLVLGAYFGYCWVRTGQTLAMKAWCIRVQRLDGARLGARQAAFRFVTACWTLLPLGLGWWWALFDGDRQFLHDRLSGTRIVRTR